MRNIYFYMPLLVVLGGIALTSCSDDDDNEGATPTAMGVIDKETGKRVTSGGGFTFRYSDDGKLLYAMRGSYDERYSFAYNPNKIVYSYQGQDESEYTVGYNGNGYFASLEYQEKSEDELESENSSFSYDSNGHLVKITSSYTSTDYYDGKTYNESGNYTVTLSWENNLLKQMYLLDTGRDDDGPFKYEETKVYTYNNSAMTNNYNKFFQYDDRILDFDSELIRVVGMVGLIGKGPAYLPSGYNMDINDEYYDSTGEQKHYTNSFSGTLGPYRFNSDGSLSSANGNYFGYDYTSSSDDTSLPFYKMPDR